MIVLEITVQRKLADTLSVVLERSQAGELPMRAEGELDLGEAGENGCLRCASTQVQVSPTPPANSCCPLAMPLFNLNPLGGITFGRFEE